MKEQEIIETVCNLLNQKEQEIKGKSRKFNVVMARHLAMYFISIECYITLKDIGNIFNKHHTTVMHALNRVEDDYYSIVKFRSIFDEIYLAVKGTPFDGEFVYREHVGKFSTVTKENLRDQVIEQLSDKRSLIEISRNLNVSVSSVYTIKKSTS